MKVHRDTKEHTFIPYTIYIEEETEHNALLTTVRYSSTAWGDHFKALVEATQDDWY